MSEENTVKVTVSATGDNAPLGVSPAREQIVDRYKSHVDHFNLSEKAKAELVLALWHIMGSHVDRAFGDDPVQLSQKDGDRFGSVGEFQDSAVLESDDNPARDATTGLTSAFSRKARRRNGKGKL